MQQNTYILITHGNTHIGMGHLARSKNTSSYLEEHGRKGTLFVNDCKETRSYFQEHKDVVFYTDRADKTGLLSYLEHRPLVIFDCNDTSQDEIFFFQEKGCKVVAFDNLGEGAEHCDLLINANFDDDSSDRHLYGEEYISLDKRFHDLSAQKTLSARTQKVVVSIGGYDEKRFSLTLFRGLLYAFYYSHYETFEMHLKLPASGGDIKPILEEAEYYHKVEVSQDENRYTIIIDDVKEIIVYTYDFIPDMSRLVLESDILLTSGGLTVYEGLTAGTYTLAFPQNTAEKTVIDRLLRKGYLPADIDTYRLQEDLEYIFELSDVEFDRFLKKSRSSFDGLGYQRVGDAFLALMN